MKAAWYDRQGAARDVLEVGELPDPDPAAGEVRVRMRLSGVNPGDTKKRRGWLGSSMAFPRVVPHSDGAGVIDNVGDGIDANRVDERVWVWGAPSRTGRWALRRSSPACPPIVPSCCPRE